MFYRLLFSILLVVVSKVDLFSQSISRSIISSYGNSIISSLGTLSSTVGEPMVATYFSPNNILTQGFEQPDTSLTTKIVDFNNSADFKIYPNPATDYVIIEGDFYDTNLQFRVTDISGRQIANGAKNVTVNSSNHLFMRFDIKNFNRGMYFLTIISNETGKPIGVLKIVKT